MATAREQIIAVTCDLLETQGYHATGLNQIIQESGSPKGSLYYYFPDGKEGLTAEAIEQAGREVAQRIEHRLAAYPDPAQAVREFVTNIAHHVEASGFRAGGPLTTVALETATSSERLNTVCRAAYQRMIDAVRSYLLSVGIDQANAAELAQFVIASIEGGIILSRTFHTGDPLRQVAEQLAMTVGSVSD